ncbi:RHS repeat-associated core domain-containing protein [Capnocytophaga gingivalis]|uniref:RHS repeat-associated core domain-containing protein n=1 Tax=Capnocytophaga gingivalis TaxID=1017 RepID=A0ABU5YEK1_9FLAO|nr:RHS repeat-associated core domain-containing protein [Capnocytophaga gingivalis]MEB3041784.1 RHS repeat-associated core domain-containing protein [Capnocytophaga gingivalis]
MSSTFRFVWDGNVLLHETFKKDNSEHTELTTWVFEGFVPTAKLVNGKAYSIISDHLGTPILAIDSDGMEVWNRQLDIYGRVRKEYKHSSLGDEVFPFVPFLYQGQYYDFETNLAYNRFRYYSPESGMYISQDPIRLNGNNPNLYAYVVDSNWWVDVFGLDCSSDAKELANNLKDRPSDQYRAHHIVMSNSTDVRMRWLRRKMERLHIGLNEEVNGIWLPEKAKYRKEGDTATAHKGEGVHGLDYRQHVWETLKGAKTKEEFEQGLAQLKSELSAGKTFAVKK